MRPSQATVRDRVERLCSGPLAERELRERVLHELRSVIDFSYFAWLLTDPETWVGTAPLAHVPDLRELPHLIRLKYQVTGNRWTSLPANRCVVRSGSSVPVRGGDAAWWDLLDGYGVTDLASLSLRDRYGSWSFLDLWRCGGTRPRFSDREVDLLDSIARPLTRGVRNAQARSLSLPSGIAVPAGPAILLLDEELHLRQHTSIVAARLRELLPTTPDLTPVPAAAYNVAAQLLAVEAGIDDRPARARAHLVGGTWISVRASRFAGEAGSGSGQIAVALETMAPHERVEIYARATGLSLRERQLVHDLARGHSTATIAHRFGIRALTVQDHLKSIFAKTGTINRYDLITRATGAAVADSRADSEG